MKAGNLVRKTDDYFITYNNSKKKTPVKAKKSGWYVFYNWLDSLVFAIILILIVFAFFFRIVGVNGDSMNPTLKNGEWLTVSAINKTIDRGDIVVITQPNVLNEPLIKRVVAVGGDTIDINFITGDVTINGQIVDEPFIKAKTHSKGDFQGPITIPEGYVFVMGDNRNDSLDSRYNVIGLIDERYVLGVVDYRLFPMGEVENADYGK